MKKYIVLFVLMISNSTCTMEIAPKPGPSMVLLPTSYLKTQLLQFPVQTAAICMRLYELPFNYHHFIDQEKISQGFAGRQMCLVDIDTMINMAIKRYRRNFGDANLPSIAKKDICKKLVSCAFIVVE